MNLQDIEAFVAVAETGSVNRAALRLNLTQPATTRRVQNLEAAMGAALLDRRTKPPSLTPVGRQALERCRRVLREVAELAASASPSGEPAGSLRVGVAHGIADVVLSSPLDELRRRFPGLRLEVGAEWTSQLIEEVRCGALDCAVGLITEDHHPLPAAVSAAAIGPERVAVVAPRDEDLPGGGARLRLADLAARSWVLNPLGCGYRAALQRAFDRARAPLRVSAEIVGRDLQLSLIARGAGLGLIPRRLLERSPHRRRLRILKVEDFAISSTVTMLHAPALGSLAAAIDHLHARIAARLAENRDE